MKLYNHQQKLLDKNPDKCLIAWEVGTGKTFMALSLTKNAVYPIVICPKSLKEQWQEQCEYPVLTKEEFKLGKNSIISDCLIIDEAHFFFGMQSIKKKSGMLKALLAYIKKHNPPYIYLLTGTPYMSTPWNIYAAAEILGHKWNYMKYKRHFFQEVNMGRRWPIPVVKKGMEGDIAKLVNKIGDTVKMEDCFDVPEQIFQTEYFDLTKEQKKAIDNLEDEGIARWTKTHQVCGGTLKSDGYSENQSFRSEKMERLLQLVEENDKLIIVCRYNYEIESIRRLLETKKLRCHTITGATKERHETVKMAEKDGSCIVLIQAQCSEGYELPSFPVMVFYSLDFSLKNYIQMCGRILRANKLKKNVYKFLVVKDTIDNDVYKCIQNKKDFDVAIYDKSRS